MTPPSLVEPAFEELVGRARELVADGVRRLLGIAGPPGAGKSTLAAALSDAFDGAAMVVPMDGFHRSNEALEAAGLRDRKGAPETFDAVAFIALLGALRTGNDVRAPSFDRDAESVVPDAIAVPGRVPLVIVEGNYLLLDDPPWSGVRPLLDRCWYLEGDDARVERLIARHVAHGRSPAAAREWVLRSDEANARLVARSAYRADLVIGGLVRGPGVRG